MKKYIVIGLMLMILLVWRQPWERSPVFFYDPLILPLNVLAGDVIVTEDGRQIVIQENQRIINIVSDNETVTITSIKRKWFWNKN